MHYSKKVNQYKVHVKKVFLIYSVLVFLVLFLLVSLFMYLNIYVFSSRNNENMNLELGKSIEDQVQNYMNFLDHLPKDQAFLECIQKQDFTAINRKLYEFVNAQKISANFILVDANAKIISTNLFKSNQQIFLESEFYESIYSNSDNRMHSSNQDTLGNEISKKDLTSEHVENHIKIFPSRVHYHSSQTGCIAISKEIKLPYSDLGQEVSRQRFSIQEAGRYESVYLIFDLLEEDLYEKTREYLIDDAIITDRYDNMLFYINRQFDDPMGKYPSNRHINYGGFGHQSGDMIEIQGKSYHVKKSFLVDQRLVLYTFVQLEFQKMLFTYNIGFLILLGILLLFTLPLIINKVANHHLYAIEKMEHYIEEIGRGHTDIDIDESLFDEFKTLAKEFKQVVRQKDELIINNHELAERKRMMEIRQLEEQFNPHFVFNTLETLRYEMLIDTDKATQMIIAFAGMMRYSIYYGKTVMPLKVDMEYIKNYLSIQKIRYNSRLSYEIKIEDDLLDYIVPKLILQPIVENSIRHGLQDKDKVHILIEVKLCENDLHLYVFDDAMGIEKQKLEEIRKNLQNKDGLSEHKGLYNPNSVIKLMYGDEYGLSIESEVGSGTKVIMRIPAKKEMEGDEWKSDG